MVQLDVDYVNNWSLSRDLVDHLQDLLGRPFAGGCLLRFRSACGNYSARLRSKPPTAADWTLMRALARAWDLLPAGLAFMLEKHDPLMKPDHGISLRRAGRLRSRYSSTEAPDRRAWSFPAGSGPCLRAASRLEFSAADADSPATGDDCCGGIDDAVAA